MHRKTILVLGMHRSGTSALARMLNLLGCDLPSTLMPGAHGNPKGHWESGAIAALNDSVLESAGSSWDDWLEFNPQWYDSPVVEDFTERALQVLQNEYGSSPLSVLKDPRNCRLTRFWFDVLGKAEIEPLIVIPLRNPLEVAESLETRNGMHFDFAILLWLRHVLDAEHGSRGRRRVFLSYEDLLNNWQALAENMQQAFGIAWPRFSIKAGMDVDAFIDEGGRHHIRTKESILTNPLLSQWVRDTDNILGTWVEKGEDPGQYSALDDIRQQLNTAGPAFAKITYAALQEKHNNIELSNLLKIKSEEFSHVNDKLNLLEEQRRQYEQQIMDIEGQASDIQQLKDAHRILEQQLADSQAALAQADARLRAAEAEGETSTAALAGDRDRLVQQVMERDAAITALNGAKADLANQLSETQQDLANLHNNLQHREREMSHNLATLNEELASARETVSRLSDEQQATAARLNDALTQGDAETAALTADRDNLAQQLSERDAALAALEAGHAALTDELRSARQDLERVSQDLFDRAHELAAVRSTLRQREEEISQTLATLEAERDRATAAELSQTEDKARIDAISDALKSANSWVFTLSGERRAADALRAEAEKRATSSEKALQSALARLADLDSRQKRYETEKSTLLAQAEVEAYERSRLEQVLVLAEKQLSLREDELTKTIDDLLDREKGTAQDLAQSQADIASLTLALRQKDEDLASTQMSGATTQAQLVAAQKALEIASAHEAELQQIASAQAAELQQKEKDGIAQKAYIQQVEVREQELTVLVESLRTQARDAARRWTVSQSEVAALSKMSKEQDMALSRLHASDATAQRQIGEQSDTIVHLSGRLQASTENVERDQRQIEWLQQVNSVLTGYPDWWAYMPKGWRQKKIEGRLKRKGLFDADAYLARYPDIVSSGMSPVQHYILHGMNEGRDFQSID